MKTWMIFTSAMLVACNDKDDDTGGSEVEDTDTETAEALWDEISGYSGWDQVDPWVGVQESADGTHGSHVQIWVNGAAASTIDAEAGGDMPDGAIIVKEGYDSADGAATAVVAMKKIDGFDPDNGDWFWAKYDTGGAVSMAGSESGCYGCHSAGQDYVLFTTW